jgi:signal peptidase I
MAVADYAHSRAGQTGGPSPRTAALLTLLTPGLGHIYLGLVWRGIALFALVIAADTLLMFSLMGVLARFWMFAISLGLLFVLWLYIVVDATIRASRMQDHPIRFSTRWPLYLVIAACAWLITAVPFLYAAHAKASGQLGYFHATAGSMEPTLREGEYVLADATYYRNHKPNRGDVVVYIHPKQPGVHFIRRVIAIEGDRVAVRGGRAVVNGMMVEEPYVDVGDPQTPYNNMAEVRVPVGKVFVLGDSRAHGADSREMAAHGAVPVDSLIGRVTDVAFSRVLTRMGRWIGTPSRF